MRTLQYLIKSFHKDADITYLKRQWALSLLTLFGIDLKITGLCSTDKKLILVGNHIGFLDILILIAAEPRATFLAKAEIAKWPIIGVAARRIGTLFVKRESRESREKSKQTICKILVNENQSTIIAGFPSGTTTMFEHKDWKKGLFDIAMASGTPVQSFRLDYSHLRECAYIDNDSLFSSMVRLFSIPRKSASLTWGRSEQITDANAQMSAMRKWTQLRSDFYEEKAFSRPSYSLQYQ